jgi:hypothetical protein
MLRTVVLGPLCVRVPVLQTRRRDENETGRTPSRNPENDREMSRQNENCPHAVFWRIEKVRKAENYRATSRRPEKCRAASRKRETEFLAENLGLVCNTGESCCPSPFTGSWASYDSPWGRRNDKLGISGEYSTLNEVNSST